MNILLFFHGLAMFVARPATSSTFVDSCGSQSKDKSSWYDEACEGYGDCCEDVHVCATPTPAPTPVPTPPPTSPGKSCYEHCNGMAHASVVPPALVGAIAVQVSHAASGTQRKATGMCYALARSSERQLVYSHRPDGKSDCLTHGFSDCLALGNSSGLSDVLRCLHQRREILNRLQQHV